MSTLSGQKILLGITGGIAAYKSADLTRRLIEVGAEVRVVMTQGAQSFITPMTLQALSGHPVHTDLLDPAAEAAMGHIELARWADTILIAPASANTIARLAHGFASDLLSTLCLATDRPIVIAPAMNRLMWSNPATSDNITTLESRGMTVIGPGVGDQACGETGAGRMLEPLEIRQHLLDAQDAPSGKEQQQDPLSTLNGIKVLITAGPTREPIDPVRFLSNRSSGKMGFAVAEAAAKAGADVTLIAGPVHLDTPAHVNRIDVTSAQDMFDAVMGVVDSQQIFISVAAVADYRLDTVATQKIKKSKDSLSLSLVRNPDILASVAGLKQSPFCVGFAAETNDVEQYATGKLNRKKLDMIAANQVATKDNAVFNSDTNALEVYWTGGGHASIATASKHHVATQLIQLIAERFLTCTA